MFPRLRITPLSARALCAVVGALSLVNGAFAQISARSAAPPPPVQTYADLADRFADSPLVLRARIASAIAVKGAVSTPGTTRFYVEADASALIRGTAGIAPRVRYLIDLAPDSRGRLPRLKKAEVLLAARPVPDRSGEIQLVAPDAQLFWTAELEARVRAIVASAAAAGAPPPVTGVTSAFHVPGTVLGEGETQLFLATATGAPVSITVLRRPGEAPRWALALGEFVDESASVPQRDTLAWYRIACFLPRDLPERAARDLAQADADRAREDYAFVIGALGPCPRTRRAPVTGA